MPGFRDHPTTPRAPLSGSELHYLAYALMNGTPGQKPYQYLAQLVSEGERRGLDARAVELARTRLEDAAKSGNAIAAGHLAVLAVEEEAGA